MTKTTVRNALRKNILAFTKGKDLTKPFTIEKRVVYNDKDYPNDEGHKCEEESGMWKLGYTFQPYEDGYVFYHWTIVQGEVTWSAEIRLNKKLTVQCSHINTFIGSPLVYNGQDTCKDYMDELMKEWGDGIFMTTENGFTFVGTEK
jgi:hypothetical protein